MVHPVFLRIEHVIFPDLQRFILIDVDLWTLVCAVTAVWKLPRIAENELGRFFICCPASRLHLSCWNYFNYTVYRWGNAFRVDRKYVKY